MPKNNNITSLQFNKPSLFEPTVIRGITNVQGDAVVLSKYNADEVSSTSLSSTSSFKYEPNLVGLKNTQQLNISWSQFENHTFFNSAQVKSNVAFQKIIDSFPFDGNRGEIDEFLDNLTGFERWVFETMPKNCTYLFFSGSNGEGSGGTYVTTQDIAGATFPNASSNTSGDSILMPQNKSMTFEFQFFAPSQSNDNQFILNKISDNFGYAITLNSTASTDYGSSTLFVVSGGYTNSTTIEFNKGQWNHLAFIWNRTPGNQQIYGYVNQELNSTSSFAIEFNSFPLTSSVLIIGSGSSFSGFTPSNTLSGAIDEFRVWHDIRTVEELKKFSKRNVFSGDDLKLYYRFNEPSGSQTRLVLDHSSNSLHGNLSLSGYQLGVRDIPTSSIAGPSPMTLEKPLYSPVLFPKYTPLVEFETTLLTSASFFDQNNPNLITRLIPQHYLLEAQESYGYENEDGNIIDPLISGSNPGTTQMGDTTAMLSMLYLWAKFFDEMKLYLQAFSNVVAIDYNSIDTVPNALLQDFARREGIVLPPLFTNSSISQFIDGDDLDTEYSSAESSLQFVQNQIWRRILVNLNSIMRSKGTLHSIKAFLRTVGIDPDNNFRIREYGGPNRSPLTFSRETRSESAMMLNFLSGGFVQSSYLTAPRTEPGYPYISGDAGNDALLTSGSWTIEGTYKFSPLSVQLFPSQSLIRFLTTGSSAPQGVGQTLMNLVAVNGQGLYLYQSDDVVSNDSLFLSGADIFDGDKWYISFGRRRNDDGLNSTISSSFFIRAAKQNFGEVEQVFQTSSFLTATVGSPPPYMQIDSTSNVSGAFLAIGSSSIDQTAYLGADGDQTSLTTNFAGKVSYLRFWSKYLTDHEWLEHVRNPSSLGVENPSSQFGFVTNVSGSWQKLRMDVSTDQAVTQSNVTGELDLFDFSQGDFGWSGSAFPLTSSVIVPEMYYYSYISPKFDEGVSVEKIRVRSFQDFQNVASSSIAQTAPVYSLPRSEIPTDNNKFSIDFSIVDALNQDIVKIFATLNELDNVIGNPELQFSPDYPGLDNLRSIYFNRLTGRMNLKSFFEFYKWFDTNIGMFIEQLIPRRTRYNGTNFVVESHMLERPKVQYKYEDAYLGDTNRDGLKPTILLRLIVGEVNRY
jgi:hypothetical protein